MTRCNATYALPLCLVTVGGACMTAGLVVLALLYSTDQLSFTKSGKSVYVMVLCGMGLLGLLLGSCSCCTLQQRAAANWNECQRLQKSHSVTLGRLGHLSFICQLPVSHLSVIFLVNIVVHN